MWDDASGMTVSSLFAGSSQMTRSQHFTGNLQNLTYKNSEGVLVMLSIKGDCDTSVCDLGTSPKLPGEQEEAGPKRTGGDWPRGELAS